MVASVRQHICTAEFHSTWKLGLHRFNAVANREQVQGSHKSFFFFHTLIIDKSRIWRINRAQRLWRAQGRPKKAPPTVQNLNSSEQLTITELLQGSDGRERWNTDFALLQLLHWLGLLQEVLVQLSLQRCQSETQQELCSPSLQPNKNPSCLIYTVFLSAQFF